MTMQLATTLKGVIPALVTLATQAMDSYVLVSFSISNDFRCNQPIPHSVYRIQILMSVLAPMEVATKTATTQMEVTHVPAMMGTCLTVMGMHVKVGKFVSDSATTKKWI